MNFQDMLSDVRDHMSRHNLIEHGHSVVVGVSGGPDSVALLDLMLRLRDDLDMEIHVAHLNHRLRGEASDLDEVFVANLAESNRLPFHSNACDLDRGGKSLEEAARDARHAFLEDVLDQTGSHRIALGHTRSDQAETFLLRLFRGAGTRGLGAIKPLRMRSGSGLCWACRENGLLPIMNFVICPSGRMNRTTIHVSCETVSGMT